MAKCEKCGKDALTETRREHAEQGSAIDHTQKVYKGLNMSVPPVECSEADADDMREVCSSCGHYTPWRKP